MTPLNGPIQDIAAVSCATVAVYVADDDVAVVVATDPSGVEVSPPTCAPAFSSSRENFHDNAMDKSVEQQETMEEKIVSIRNILFDAEETKQILILKPTSY